MQTRRGDVVLVLFPNSDLRTAKRRPALVIQAPGLDAGLPQTRVAMITSNLAGLRTDSVLMADNIATVADSEIDSVLGSLPDMTAVDAALKHTLALP